MSTRVVICGYEQVDPAQRDRIVERFMDMVSRAREFDGCLHMSLTADSVDSRRINVVEVWRDAQSLQAWRRQADAPEIGDAITFMDIRRYDATDGGPLFERS